MNRRYAMLCAVLLVLFCLTTAVHAREIPAGTIQISGSSDAGFGRVTEKVEGNKTTESDRFDVGLEGLYYVAKNLGLGLVFGYNYADIKDTSSTSRGGSLSSKYKSKSIGPVAQLSVPLNEVTNLSLGAAAGYVSEKVVDSYETDGFFYGANVGVSLFPVQSVSVDLGLAYLRQSVDADYDIYRNIDVEHETLAAQIGLSLYF